MYNKKMTDGYSLTQLQQLSGEPVRRIRSYIQQDLLPRPKQLGRNARYSKATLTRLLAIKRLRTIEGFSITEVRTVLSNLDDSQIKNLSTYSLEPGVYSLETTVPNIDPARSRTKTIGERVQSLGNDSALEYLRSLKDKNPHPDGDADVGHQINQVFRSSNRSNKQPIDQETFAVNQSGSPLRKLISRLNQLTPASRVQRRARSEEWMKIPITADIQLHVRSSFGNQDRAALELLADYIREAMIGEV